MRFLKTILIVSIFTSISLFSKFYSVRSQRELELKLQQFEYAFVCFAALDQDGVHIKNIMKSLAVRDDFQDTMDYGVVILFVYVNGDTLPFALDVAYQKKPLFVFFKHDQIIAQTDFGHHYTVELMKNFIDKVLAQDSGFNVGSQALIKQNKFNQQVMHAHMHYHRKHKANQWSESQSQNDLVDDEPEYKQTVEQIYAAKKFVDRHDDVKKESPYWLGKGNNKVKHGYDTLKYRAYFPENIKN